MLKPQLMTDYKRKAFKTTQLATTYNILQHNYGTETTFTKDVKQLTHIL